jgi:hypothetical protein
LCGIFGFILKKPTKVANVFRILQRLEKHQYPNEPKPVGGYGAGIVVLASSGKVLIKKVGRINGSPAEHLPKVCKFNAASVLLGMFGCQVHGLWRQPISRKQPNPTLHSASQA